MLKNIYTPKALNSSLRKSRTEELEELYFTQLKTLKCEIKKDDSCSDRKYFFKVKSKRGIKELNKCIKVNQSQNYLFRTRFV